MPLPMVKFDPVLASVLEGLDLSVKAILETDRVRVVVLELPGGGELAQIIVTESHAAIFDRRPLSPDDIQRMEVRFPKSPLGTTLAAKLAAGYRNLLENGGSNVEAH